MIIIDLEKSSSSSMSIERDYKAIFNGALNDQWQATTGL